MDAVGADDDVGLDLAAVREARDRDVTVGQHFGASLAQGHDAGRESVGQHVEEVGRKLGVLRQHCEAVGRDYAQIEKTTMVIIDPSTTREDVIRAAAGAREAGFTAAYIAAKDITEPDRIIDLLASALPELR